jgi:hypothetical protein
MTRSALRCTTLLFAALAYAACGSDETEPEESHTPHGVALFVGGVSFDNELVLTVGQPVRVEVRFLDQDGAVISGIEAEHHAGLTFTPATLATVASVPGHNFQKDVTGQATPDTGSVMVGYGHDEAADEPCPRAVRQ